MKIWACFDTKLKVINHHVTQESANISVPEKTFHLAPEALLTTCTRRNYVTVLGIKLWITYFISFKIYHIFSLFNSL